PEATPPYLSASAELITINSEGLLYRARLRDSTGADYNALYFYDFASAEHLLMPFFGKDPIWTPDGTPLIGARLGQTADGQPIYQLWEANIYTHEERQLGQGCNPVISGIWLAYDMHDSAQWQNYT